MASLVDQFGVGIHTNIPDSVYYTKNLGECNKSALDVVNRSLYHYRHWVDQVEQEETEALIFGRAFHCAVLEPEKYLNNWMVLPDFGPMQSSTNRAAKKRWMERHADKSFVPETMAENISAMARAIRNHENAGNYIGGGVAEVTACWIDEPTGLHCKAKVDYWLEEFAAMPELKSCLDASPEGFARSVHNYRYHVQQAHTTSGFAACGQPLERFLFICVEKEAPHAVAVYLLNAHDEQLGFDLRDRDMRMLAKGMQESRFPSYNNNQTTELRLPAYAHFALTE